MAIDTPREIDWSTFPTGDGEPMAETCANAMQMFDLMEAFRSLFRQQGRFDTTTIGGNQFLYYNRYNGREHLAPDVYVAFGVTPPAPPAWKTWVQGKNPDIVFEISSESTYKEDRGTKREIYERLGVREYYIFDPQWETTPPFLGYESRAGRFEPLPLLPSGGIWSPLLATELRPVASEGTSGRPAAIYLRVIDPASRQPLPMFEEISESIEAAQEQLNALQEQLLREGQALRAAEQRARQEEQARQEAEQRARQEEQARREAEQRAAQAEAALQAALAALAQRQDETPGDP